MLKFLCYLLEKSDRVPSGSFTDFLLKMKDDEEATKVVVVMVLIVIFEMEIEEN